MATRHLVRPTPHTPTARRGLEILTTLGCPEELREITAVAYNDRTAGEKALRRRMLAQANDGDRKARAIVHTAASLQTGIRYFLEFDGEYLVPESPIQIGCRLLKTAMDLAQRGDKGAVRRLKNAVERLVSSGVLTQGDEMVASATEWLQINAKRKVKGA